VFDAHTSAVTTSRLDLGRDGKLRLKAESSASNAWVSYTSVVIPANFSADGTQSRVLCGSAQGRLAAIPRGTFRQCLGHRGRRLLCTDRSGEGEDVIDWNPLLIPIMKVPDNCKPPKGRSRSCRITETISHRVDVCPLRGAVEISGDRQSAMAVLGRYAVVGEARYRRLRDLEPRNSCKAWDQGYSAHRTRPERRSVVSAACCAILAARTTKKPATENSPQPPSLRSLGVCHCCTPRRHSLDVFPSGEFA